MKKLNQKGFTLVELLVVIAIIGILAVVAVPALFKNINKSKIAKVESDYNAVKSAVVAYYSENNVLANDIDSLNIDGLSDREKTPIGGEYKIRSKDIDKGYVIADVSGNSIRAYKIKPNGDIDRSDDDKDESGRIRLDKYGDVFLSIQGLDKTNLSHINKEQFNKLVEDIGYENIYISSAPKGTAYQTSELYIRIANNILPKPIK